MSNDQMHFRVLTEVITLHCFLYRGHVLNMSAHPPPSLAHFVHAGHGWKNQRCRSTLGWLAHMKKLSSAGVSADDSQFPDRSPKYVGSCWLEMLRDTAQNRIRNALGKNTRNTFSAVHCFSP